MGDVDTWKGLCHNKVADSRDGCCQEKESPLLCLILYLSGSAKFFAMRLR